MSAVCKEWYTDALQEWVDDPERRARAVEAMHLIDGLALEYEGEFVGSIDAEDLLDLFAITPEETQAHMKSWIKIVVATAREPAILEVQDECVTESTTTKE